MPLKIGARGTPDRIEWDAGTGLEHVLYLAVQGNPGTAKHQERMEAAVNAALVTKQLLSTLPPDDPDRLGVSDAEYGGRLYWGDADGKKTSLEPFNSTYLISRAVAVTIDFWDGEKYVCTTRRV